VIPERPRPETPCCVGQDRSAGLRASSATSQCIDWFHEGETKVVEIDGVRITVRFIGRKGRRGRIAIEAPAGAVFQSVEHAQQTC
jgi:hypothetical protein